MFLLAGDLILTEQNTWLEIGINRGASLIKIAENTTFSINSLENRGGTFGVSYGRIRAKVEKLTEESPFWIQGVDTVAGVRGTDFGFDLFYKRESPGKARTDVYCFEGKVEVVKIVPESTGTVKPLSSVLLGRNQMVSVYSESTEDLEKEKLTGELKSYWNENDFRYVKEPPEALKAPESGEIFFSNSRQLKQAALYTAVSGTIISAMAAGSYYLADNSTGAAVGLGSVGGFLLTSALVYSIRAVILDRREISTLQPSAPGK